MGENKPLNRQTWFTLAFFGLIAFIPNITVTDSEHFLFCLPLVCFIICLFPKLPSWLKIVSIAALCAYGCNWHDLWGNRVSGALEGAGVLGIGNLAIILLSFGLYLSFSAGMSDRSVEFMAERVGYPGSKNT